VFEKYTEKARRVIFFARYEVSQLGATSIEPEHLLLGLLREEKALVYLFTAAGRTTVDIRKQIEERAGRGPTFATTVEVPLSNVTKTVLTYAAEESNRLGHSHIGTEHLLMGLLCMENSLAQEILLENGVNLPDVRRHFQSSGGKLRVMTELLEKAFTEASKLSADEQDFLAKILLDKLASEELSEQSFAESQGKLAELADEAIAENQENKTKDLEESL